MKNQVPVVFLSWVRKRHVKPVDPDPNGEKLLQVASIS
jgi:hypothetical protein